MTKLIKHAILLAAGYGTRLRPLTNTLPKCLVPINGKPLLYIWLDNLAAAGVKHFIVNTHYLPEMVEQAIQCHPLRDRITLAHEPELLGTAGTVRSLLNSGLCPEDDLLIAHADNLCLCDWSAFFQHFQDRPNISLVSAMSFKTDTPESCGIFELNAEGIATAFYEKVDHPPGDLANAAIYCFSAQALSIFTELNEQETDISLDVIHKCLGRLSIWFNTDYMRDIGTLESYKQAQLDVEGRI